MYNLNDPLVFTGGKADRDTVLQKVLLMDSEEVVSKRYTLKMVVQDITVVTLLYLIIQKQMVLQLKL